MVNYFETAYRVSSKKLSGGFYVGRVSYYQRWRKPERHDSLYRRSLGSVSTKIKRTTAADAQWDAVKLGREHTGYYKPDNGLPKSV